MARKESKTVNRKREQVRHRRVLPRLAALTGWLVAMALALSLLLAGAGYLIYRNLTETVNLVFAELVDGQEVTVGGISFPKPGRMRIDDVRMRDPEGAGDWLEVAEVEIDYDWEDLKKHRHIKSLRLKRPVLRIDEGVVDSLKKTGVAVGGKKNPEGGGKGFDLSFLGKLTEGIVVEGGRAVVEWPGAPTTSFVFDSSLDGLHSQPKGKWISDEPLKLSLREVVLGPEAAPVLVERVEVEALVGNKAQVIEVVRLEIDKPEVRITPQWLVGFGGVRKAGVGDGRGEKVEGVVDPASKKTGASEDSGSLEILLRNVGIKNGNFGLSGFDGTDGVGLLPEVAFGASVEWKGIVIDGSGVRAGDPLTLKLEKVRVDGAMDLAGQPDLLRAEELEAVFLPQAVLRDRRIEKLTMRRPELRLSADNLARLAGKKADSESAPVDSSKSPQQEQAPSEKAASGAFHLGSVLIEGGRFTVGEMGSRVWPDIETELEGELRELAIGGAGGAVGSAEGQRLRLSGLKVNGGKLGAGDPLAAVAQVEMDFQFDGLLQEKMVDRLEIHSPEVEVSDYTLSRWMGGGKETESVEGQTDQGVAGDGESKAGAGGGKIWRVRDLKVSDGSLVTRLEKSVQGVPWLRGHFDIQTLPEEVSAGKGQEQDPRYRLKFSGLRIRPQHFITDGAGAGREVESNQRGEISERDAVFVRELTLEASAGGLQREKRIESVVVSGGEVKLNDEFRALIGVKETSEKNDADSKPKQEKPPVMDAKKGEDDLKVESGSGWSIGELGVSQTVVRLEAMVPQLEGVQFSIETKMQDVPLTAEGLASRSRIQQVELAGIELRDPYDGIRTAAMLKTIFIKFSLGGLMRQELESVDILGPVLYVGEPLFHWVDYQRNYRQQNEGTSLGPEEWRAEGDKKEEGGAGEKGAWKLKRINAHYGKMVIAPIGTPIGIVPFPFEVETNLEHGEIALKLEIPQEQYVYSLADLKLDLFGLKGEVQFNVPIKQMDNNLVQTFELDRLVWKQFDAEKIFVSVTYDANGIYGQLGGKAYDGYVNGEFNIYLKDIGKWDGWLAATKVDMAPITQAIAPENFVMDGIISGKIVSEGKGLKFGNTSGELEGVTPGRIEITKLDEVLKALPEDWTQLKRSLTEAALNGLKTFDYDKASGKMDLVNRDGELGLDLQGPTGSRVFHFYLHDWREKEKLGIRN